MATHDKDEHHYAEYQSEWYSIIHRVHPDITQEQYQQMWDVHVRLQFKTRADWFDADAWFKSVTAIRKDITRSEFDRIWREFVRSHRPIPAPDSEG